MKHPYTIATLGVIMMLGLSGEALAQASDDRFILRIGALQGEGTASLDGAVFGSGESAAFSESFDLGKDTVPRVDGMLRLGNRHRLLFDYIRSDVSERATLGQNVTVDGIIVPAGSYAEAEIEFQLASAIYDFAIVQNDGVSLGLQIGAEYARLDGALAIASGDVLARSSEKVDGIAPVVGVRFTATPAQNWMLTAQAQHLDADWGSFDFDGKIDRANALIEYRVGGRIGLFAGYERYKLSYSESGRDARGGIALEFKGPMAGVTVAF